METTHLHSDARVRRFKPWGNIARIFRRKPEEGQGHPRSASRSSASLTSLFAPSCVRSKSTSELLAETEPEIIIPNDVRPTFPAAGSSLESIVDTLDTATTDSRVTRVNSVFSISIHHLDELKSVIRRRRSSTEDEDEDLGLPHSPTTDSLGTVGTPGSNFQGRGLNSNSTGSDASLLSMDSYGITEGETTPPLKQTMQQQQQDILQSESEVPDEKGDCPLNHSAALHKMAVRPKRNHAAPRHRKLQQLSGNSGEVPVSKEVNTVVSAPESIELPESISSSVDGLEKWNINGGSPQKQRSQSMSRGETLATQQTTSNTSSSSASSTKLARSKSNVDKKIQHDVLTHFWKKTKNPEESSRSPVSTETGKPTSCPEPAAPKRRDLRKIKREKEEKRRKENNFRSNFESPFLSRIFSSRRKQFKIQDSDTRHNEDSGSTITVISGIQDKGYESISIKPESLSRESDTRIDKLPRFSGPQHQKRIGTKKVVIETADTEKVEVQVQNSNRPRIHIAGLSPYQRRVARVGNGLEISDEDIDEELNSFRNKRIHLNNKETQNQRRSQSFRQNNENEENNLDSLNSLPADINKDFILKKPDDNSGPQNFRKSLETFKFSNEGLKKTIDSLNNRPVLSNQFSRSSDQLMLSDDSTKRSCSLSTDSTSSLNISDTEVSPLSSLTLSKESLDLYASEGSDLTAGSPDEEQQKSCEISVFHNSKREVQDLPEFLQIQLHKVEQKNNEFTSKSSKTGDSFTTRIKPEFEISSPVTDRSLVKPEILPKPNFKPKPEIQAKPKLEKIRIISNTNGSTQKPQLEKPVFSMSVRVQNGGYGRSLSVPAKTDEKPGIVLHVRNETEYPDPNKIRKPFVTSIRMTNDETPIVPKILPRPWLMQDEKDRSLTEKTPHDQLVNSQDRKEKPSEQTGTVLDTQQSTDVKIRNRGLKENGTGNPAGSKDSESELMKVFARRSLKVPEDDDLSLEQNPEEYTKNLVPKEESKNVGNDWKNPIPQKGKLVKQSSDFKVSKATAARNSKVLDMVNSFQRLQVT